MSSIRNKDGLWINTEVFREEARYFEKYGKYPGGNKSTNEFSEYQLYWKEQDRRCKYGYEVGGVRITGDHYNYLNFNQIRLKEREDDTVENLSKKYFRKATKKKVFFPDFWDGDYDYFHALEIAERGIPDTYGISFSDPKVDEKVLKAYNDLHLNIKIHDYDLAGGLHIMVAKARRKGFSFKNGSILVNRYKRVPNFTGVLAGYEMKYITPMGTMDMCNDYIDFINANTAWRRIKTVDKKLHQKDAYEEVIEGTKVEKGFKSQIIGLTCKDNPSAIRGKDPDIAMLEEGGTWPNLDETVAATLPSLGAGIYTTGLMVIFGTGSAEVEEWGPFESMFYEPKTNGFIRIENEWDVGAEGTFCSFYFPDKLNKEGFYDEHGNSDIKGALQYEKEYKEELSKTTSSQKKVQLRTIEHANCPQETFSVLSGNIFPTEELRAQRNYVITRMPNFGTPGRLSGSIAGEVDFIPDSTIIPINHYPHKKSEPIIGGIVQYAAPIKIGGEVPDNLYIICHDPYDQEESSDSSSLGVAYVIMNPNNVVQGQTQGNVIVASYIGRTGLDDYNRNLFLLATRYNAKVGFENDRGDVQGFAKRHTQCFKYMEPEFQLGWTDGMNNRLGRSYGMSMAGGKKDVKRMTGNLFIKEWLLEERGKDENGMVLMNLNFIYDLGLLDELIKFNTKGNFDRVSALRIGMYHKRELLYNQVKMASSKDADSSVSRFFRSKLAS